MKKQKQYNAVVCWNRGGSSALMLALKQSGIPIVGFKYPWRFTFDYVNLKTKKVEKTKVNKDGGLLEPLKNVKENNPKGFWELSTVTSETGMTEEFKDVGEDGDVVKISSRVFPSSDPDLINKVIVVARDPRKILASQMKCNDNLKDIDQEQYIRVASLSMIYNMGMVWKWIKRNKKRVMVVRYEQLLKDPKWILNVVHWFLERKGDLEWGAKVIDKKLDRVKPVKSKAKELEVLMDYYESNFTKRFNLDKIKESIKELDKESKITNL